MSATSGPTSLRQFAFFDPDSCVWKTWPAISLWGSETFSETLPPSGTTRSGRLYERPTWGPATDEPDCSSLLGTPTAHERTHSPRQVHHGQQLANQVALLPTPAVNDMGDRPWAQVPGAWDAWVEKHRAQGINGNGHGRSLAIEAQRLLPTPVASDWKGPNRSGSGSASSRGMATVAERFLPTPTARDWKGENQRRDETCLPGAVRGVTTYPPSSDTPLPWEDQPLPLWTTEDD